MQIALNWAGLELEVFTASFRAESSRMDLAAGINESPGALKDPGSDQGAITLLADHPPSGLVKPPSISGYEISAELGRGGMGVVYEALQLSLKRRVALKVVRIDKNEGPEVQRRFQ